MTTEIKERRKVLCGGTLDLAGVKADVYVLDDGTRILSQRSIVRALTFKDDDGTGQPEAGRKAGDLRSYLSALPSKYNQLSADANIIEFETLSGAKAHGRSAEWFSEFIACYVDALMEGSLRKNQQHLAIRARAIERSFRGVAVVALIDESTGYQYRRASTELQDLYARILRQDPAPWEKLWETDIVASLCKTFRIPYDGTHYPVVLNGVVGMIYEIVLGKEVRSEMKRRNPRGPNRNMHHQHFTDGLRKLAVNDLQLVKSISDQSANKLQFWARLRRQYQKTAVQLELVSDESQVYEVGKSRKKKVTA